MVFLCYIFIVIVFDIVVTFYTLFNIENDSLLVVKKIFSAFFFTSCVLPRLLLLLLLFLWRNFTFSSSYSLRFLQHQKKTKIKRILLWKVWDEKKWERKVKGWKKEESFMSNSKNSVRSFLWTRMVRTEESCIILWKLKICGMYDR